MVNYSSKKKRRRRRRYFEYFGWITFVDPPPLDLYCHLVSGKRALSGVMNDNERAMKAW